MARIPDAELEQIKRDTDLVALVQTAGVELRRHGANLVGRCRFHDDQTASLIVTPSKNLWHCMGACQAGGSVIDWVMRAERVSFRHAVEWLRARAGSAPASALAPIAASAKDAESIDDTALLRDVLEFYHETLKTSPEAIAYLETRGLNAVDLIDHFRLGYANRTLGYRLQGSRWKAGATLRGRLQQRGILRASGHEHFRGSLVVPILGERGQLVQCYGRKLRDDLREGTPLHLYLPGPHAAVWNVDALASSKEIILCEALFDAMTFWVAGFRNVITSYGVSGFTDAHRAALRRSGTERVLVAYDADAAGDRAAEQVAEELTRMGIECYRVHFPRGLDANAYALAHAPASESLGALLRGATWLGRGDQVIAPVAVSSSLAAAPAAPSVVSPSVATAPPSPLTTEHRGDEVLCMVADRHYRVRGLAKNQSPDALRVNLLVKRSDDVHVDTLDLYVARVRSIFIAQAAKELGVSEETIKRDVGAVILALESLVAEQVAAVLAPSASAVPAMSETDRAAALALLQNPRLLDQILTDFERAGVVGEETNKLVGYLAAVSRKLPEPLAIIIQSASASGKTSLMDAVLAFVPPEERVQYSAMTGQALFYMAETNLKHKVLAVVEEEGAERASYALKLLQSEGELTIASTGKDPDSGKLVTHEYRVEGPVMIMLTTTAVELDEELVNRALVLTVDEDRDQTRAIHERQRARRTLDGRLASVAKAELLNLHRNAQRLIEPITIVNPYAPQLTFVDARTRARRDHEKYLTLIDTVALLHQHQRERKTVTRGAQSLTYLEVTREDIAIANRLAAAVLGRSLDELPPQTRRFLGLLDAWITRTCPTHRHEFRFLARDAREAIGLGATQVKLHLHRLVELEYVLVHRAPRGQGVSYELVYTAADHTAESTIFSGLRDSTALTNISYDSERSDASAQRPDRGRPPVGGRSVEGRSARNPSNPRADIELVRAASVAVEITDRDASHRARHTVAS